MGRVNYIRGEVSWDKVTQGTDVLNTHYIQMLPNVLCIWQLIELEPDSNTLLEKEIHKTFEERTDVIRFILGKKRWGQWWGTSNYVGYGQHMSQRKKKYKSLLTA